MDKIPKILISSVIVCFLVVSIILASDVFISSSNPTSESITKNNLKFNSSGSSSKLLDTLTEFSNKSSQAIEEINEATPSKLGYIFLIFDGAMEIPKLFIGILTGFSQTILNIVAILLTGSTMQDDSILKQVITIGLNLIFAIILSLVVFYLIKLFRTGQS